MTNRVTDDELLLKKEYRSYSAGDIGRALAEGFNDLEELRRIRRLIQDYKEDGFYQALDHVLEGYISNTFHNNLEKEDIVFYKRRIESLEHRLISYDKIYSLIGKTMIGSSINFDSLTLIEYNYKSYCITPEIKDKTVYLSHLSKLSSLSSTILDISIKNTDNSVTIKFVTYKGESIWGWTSLIKNKPVLILEVL